MMKPSTYFLSALLLSGFVVFGAIWFTGPDPEPGHGSGPARTLTTGGFALKLTEFGKVDAMRFFRGLGMASKHVDVIRRSGCLFQARVGNDGRGKSPVIVEYRNWEVRSGGESYNPWQTEVWTRLLYNMALPAGQQRAFEAALLQEDIAVHPLDEAKGLIGFALPPGTKFDLVVHWIRDGKPGTARLDGLTCPTIAVAESPTA